MFRLYHFLKTCIICIYRTLILIPTTLCGWKRDISIFIKSSAQRFINLRESNINLAIFYLESGKLRDALMRLYIIEKWITPNDPEAQYYKGWVYLLQCRYTEALAVFKKVEGVRDAKEIAYFLTMSNNAEQRVNIPSSMHGQYKDFTVAHIEPESALAISGVYLATCVLEYIDEIPLECRFLEIDSNGAIVAQQIRTKMLNAVEYDVIESGSSSAQLMQVLEWAEKPLYDNVYSSIEDVSDAKYDVILSIWGGNQYASLTDHLVKIKRLLKPYGVIIFAHRVADIPSFDMHNMLLLHTKSQLVNDLKLANLQIDSITVEQINHSQNAFVVCSPISV